MRRCLATVLSLLVLLALSAGRAEAMRPHNPEGPETKAGRARYVCVPNLVWRTPEMCPSYGPGTTPYRVAAINLPNPLPELPVEEIPQDDGEPLVNHTYAYVKVLPLNVYRHPMEAAMGLPPVRTMLSGDWWVSLVGSVEYEGQLWYQINPDEFVPADALILAAPSRFRASTCPSNPSIPSPG